MQIIINAWSAEASLWLAQALIAHPSAIEAREEESFQEFVSALYRDPDAVGVLLVRDGYLAATRCRSLRDAGVRNPILVLVADTAQPDIAASGRARVLMAGADDVQPFPLDDREIVARLDALSRRGPYNDHLRVRLPGGAVFTAGSGAIECEDGRRIRITAHEGALLSELARHPDETRTKNQIMDALYGGNDEPDLKIIDVFVCKLRRKIVAATGGADVVRTVWGRGYMFVEAGFTGQDKRFRDRGPLSGWFQP